MRRPALLRRDDALARLSRLQERAPYWRLCGKALHATFEFADFAAAFGFMTEVALAAEKLQHHPDWTNSYKSVSIALSTHAAGGVTALDFRLAGIVGEIARRRMP